MYQCITSRKGDLTYFLELIIAASNNRPQPLSPSCLSFFLSSPWQVNNKLTTWMTNVAEVESDAAKLTCEQVLLFGRAKRAARERVSERERREGPRFLSRVYFSRYPPNGEPARRLQQNSSVTIQALTSRILTLKINQGTKFKIIASLE